MLVKTTLAVLAQLIKEDASLKLAQGSVLLVSVSLVFFSLSSRHLCLSSLSFFYNQDTVLITKKTGYTTKSSKVIDGLKSGLQCKSPPYILKINHLPPLCTGDYTHPAGAAL